MQETGGYGGFKTWLQILWHSSHQVYHEFGWVCDGFVQ